MWQTIRLIPVELRRQFRLLVAYAFDALIGQLIYIFSFLLLNVLIQIITGGQYSQQQQSGFLVAYVTWWTAGRCLFDTVQTVANDARWGTLEQLRLTGASPAAFIAARAVNLMIYYTLQGVLMAVVLMLLLGISPPPMPLAFWGAYLLTLLGALGASFILAGLHLVFKNISALADFLSFLLFFLGGVMTPLIPGTVLYAISRWLPLSAGIDVMRLAIAGASIETILASADLVWLLLNSAGYLLLGGALLGWAFRRAQREGSLAHY
jgi:ABC-2 type transport system permease protein